MLIGVRSQGHQFCTFMLLSILKGLKYLLISEIQSSVLAGPLFHKDAFIHPLTGRWRGSAMCRCAHPGGP